MPDDAHHARAKNGRDATADAAWKRLTDHDDLARLGLSATKLAKEAHVAETTAGHHLASGNVLNDLARRLVEEMEQSGRENSAEYQLASKHIPNIEGDNATQIAKQARSLIGTVLQLDLEDSRFGERIWYALIAIADLDPTALGKNVNLKERLQEGHDANQRGYEAAYDAFCAISEREYVHSRERTMHAVNSYLEGVAVQRRFGRGPQTQDELIDTVVRIFWAMTKPRDGALHDVDQGSSARRPSGPSRRRPNEQPSCGAAALEPFALGWHSASCTRSAPLSTRR